MGEIIAWIIGWDLILEMFSAAAVIAKCWGVYLSDAFQLFGIDVGFFYVKASNYVPFIPPSEPSANPSGLHQSLFSFVSGAEPSMCGIYGLLSAAALAVVTVLYILVTLVVTGMVSYKDLAASDTPSLTTAFMMVDADWAGKVSSAGILVAIVAGFFNVNFLEEMINIGTLSAFVLVSFGVPLLRRRRPDLNKNYRVPWSPMLPIISGVACMWLMFNLSIETWLRFVIWLAIGMAIYLTYGYRHSRLRAEASGSDASVDAAEGRRQTQCGYR